MKATRIPGFTRIMGVDQRYQALPIRDETLHVNDMDVNSMTAEFKFSEVEIAQIIAGGTLRVTILGNNWPPILVHVHTPKEDPTA